MIVDCHTHWGMGWEERDKGDPTQWLAVLNKHGVDKAILLGHANIHRHDLHRADNDRLADLTARYPDRFIPFPTVWPQTGDEALAEVRRCLVELKMSGLKFHPWVQGFSTASPVFGEICALAGELGKPILLHDGTPCYSLPEQIGGLARRFPATQFILGHSGLMWHWRSALEAARHPNVWSCLCGPHLRGVELFCERADPDRLLWGSDFGFNFADAVDYRLNLMLRARIDDALLQKILGDNAVRLLSLE